jgi:hypothetical protein
VEWEIEKEQGKLYSNLTAKEKKLISGLTALLQKKNDHSKVHSI